MDRKGAEYSRRGRDLPRGVWPIPWGIRGRWVVLADAGGAIAVPRASGLSQNAQSLHATIARMRQIGALTDERQAQKLVDYLVSLGIASNADAETGSWLVWVRDEDRVAEARTILEAFQQNPQDTIYQDASAKAQVVRREEAKKRELARRNWVDMRNHWNGGIARRTPVVTALIVLSIGIAIITQFARFNPDPHATVHYLTFSDTSKKMILDPMEEVEFDAFAQLRQGQIWRLVTPVFVHFTALHLAFNMYMLYVLGSPIETRRGRWRFLVIFLTLAALSNFAQAWVSVQYPESSWGGSPLFGGMSGVVYGLLGYLWMKALYDPGAGLSINPQTVYFLLFWLVLCFTGLVGNIANTAHTAGLIVGMAIGYAPCLFPSRRT